MCNSVNRPRSLTEEQAGPTAQEGISVPLSRWKPTQSMSTPHFVRCHVNSCIGRCNNLPPSDSARNARVPNTSVLIKLDLISLFRYTHGSTVVARVTVNRKLHGVTEGNVGQNHRCPSTDSKRVHSGCNS